MKIRIRKPREQRHEESAGPASINEPVIERDTSNQVQVTRKREKRKNDAASRFRFILRLFHKESYDENMIKAESRNWISRIAYTIFHGRLPSIPEYKEVYEQAGMPLVYEAYLSSGFLLGFIAIIPAFVISFLLESRMLFHPALNLSLLGSGILAVVIFSATLLLWLAYPIFRRRAFKSALENQLAYSFGILGVLSAAGMTLDRLFERIGTSESNPVLAELAKRFLRNIRIFGMDSETALKEVANHSPSAAFAAMLESIAVAYKTTGTIHNLVMFESSRLLQEKGDNLRKTIASL